MYALVLSRSLTLALSFSLQYTSQCPNPETRIRDRIKRSPPHKCQPFDTTTVSMFLSLSLASFSIFLASSLDLMVPSLSHVISLFLSNASPEFIGTFSIGAYVFPPRNTHHPVRYSAYMIRCNYNQVNNCYGRYRRALCAKGWPGESVTNTARFVRRPAPITPCQRTEEGRLSPTIRLQLGISSFWSQRLCHA